MNNVKEMPKKFYYQLRNSIMPALHADYAFLCKNFMTIGLRCKVDMQDYANCRQQEVDGVNLYRFGIPSDEYEFSRLKAALVMSGAMR